MIEILILYIIQKREKTMYAIRKEIFDVFGSYTKPSIGTIYPALKRLLKMGAINLNERMSEGGKKSSYYSITPNGIKAFRDLFFDTTSDNPSLFYPQLLTRISIMDFLSIEDRKLFLQEAEKQIELLQLDIKKKLNDEFLKLTYYQKVVLDSTKTSLTSLSEFIKKIKVENDG